MPTSIRITLTPELEKVLAALKEERFGLLEPPEIIRAILSEYNALRMRRLSSARPTWMTSPEWSAFQVWEESLPTMELSTEQHQAIEAAKKEKGVALPRTKLWKSVPKHRA